MRKHERPVAFFFGEETSLPPDRPLLAPPVDVVEDAHGWRLVFEIPGADPDQIAVDVQGRTLTLRGFRRATDRADGLFLRVERAAGARTGCDRVCAASGAATASAPHKATMILISRVPVRAAYSAH